MQETSLPALPQPGSIDRPAPNVAGLKIVMVNVYAITAPDGSWVLVDAGLPFSAGRIRSWAESHFGPDKPPTSILLTHGHFDHVGAIRELADGWNVPVYAHALEMPYITGKSKYPPPDPTVGGGAMAVMSPLYPRGPIDITERVRQLPQDGSVPGLSGWRWIHTPGHAPGHVSFFREQDRVLIAGDAFVTTKQESLTAVIMQKLEFHGPPSYYTIDWEAARTSIQELAALEPEVVACGHGMPVRGPEAAAGVRRLAAHFNRLVLPETGRYVDQPAVTDENGIVSLPPAPSGFAPQIALAAVAIGTLWFMLRRQQQRY